VFEKPSDVARAEVARMLFAVKDDVASRPLSVAFARLGPPESCLGRFAKLIEQARRLGPGDPADIGAGIDMARHLWVE
jgi:hypothetical protein